MGCVCTMITMCILCIKGEYALAAQGFVLCEDLLWTVTTYGGRWGILRDGQTVCGVHELAGPVCLSPVHSGMCVPSTPLLGGNPQCII